VRLATKSHGVFFLFFVFLTFQGRGKGKLKQCIPRCPRARSRCARKNNNRGGGGVRGGHAPRNHTTLPRGGLCEPGQFFLFLRRARVRRGEKIGARQGTT
jgi:hypothetical protein